MQNALTLHAESPIRRAKQAETIKVNKFICSQLSSGLFSFVIQLHTKACAATTCG